MFLKRFSFHLLQFVTLTKWGKASFSTWSWTARHSYPFITMAKIADIWIYYWALILFPWPSWWGTMKEPESKEIIDLLYRQFYSGSLQPTTAREEAIVKTFLTSDEYVKAGNISYLKYVQTFRSWASIIQVWSLGVGWKLIQSLTQTQSCIHFSLYPGTTFFITVNKKPVWYYNWPIRAQHYCFISYNYNTISYAFLCLFQPLSYSFCL